MGSFSIWHWLIVGLVIVLLFGGGKLARVMGEFGQGIKAFRRNVKDSPDEPARLDGAADSKTSKKETAGQEQQ